MWLVAESFHVSLGGVGLKNREEGENDDGAREAGPDDGEQPLHRALK